AQLVPTPERDEAPGGEWLGRVPGQRSTLLLTEQRAIEAEGQDRRRARARVRIRGENRVATAEGLAHGPCDGVVVVPPNVFEVVQAAQGAGHRRRQVFKRPLVVSDLLDEFQFAV